LAAIVAEARRPNHGRLGSLAALVREVRRQHVPWARHRPWAHYTPDDLVGVLEDFAEHHIAGELAIGLDPARSRLDDRTLREAFAVADDVEWAGLKWDVFLALAPLPFARIALRLDVLRPYATQDLLRRFEAHKPGAWATLAAIGSDVGTPRTPTLLGRALSRAIFPQLLQAHTREIGESATKVLTRMAWAKVPAWSRSVVNRDAPADPDQRRRRQDDETYLALWKALGEMCTGQSAPDLFTSVLEGKFDIAPRKIANRIQDAARTLQDSGPGSRHAATLSIRDAGGTHVSVTVRQGSAEERERLSRLLREEQARSLNTLKIVDEARTTTATASSMLDIVSLAAQNPDVARGLDIHVARERGDSWEELETRYGHRRQVLDRWRKNALDALRDRLGGGDVGR
jgi:hypothetical protein